MVWVRHTTAFDMEMIFYSHANKTHFLRRHFACACVLLLNDNSVGASNVMAGNRELAWSYSHLKSNFFRPLNTVLSYKNCSPYKWQKTDVFYAGFSCRFFSGRFSWPFLKRLNAKNHCSCINLIFTGRAMHFYDFYGLISKLMVLLIKGEMHCSNVQLL